MYIHCSFSFSLIIISNIILLRLCIIIDWYYRILLIKMLLISSFSFSFFKSLSAWKEPDRYQRPSRSWNIRSIIIVCRAQTKDIYRFYRAGFEDWHVVKKPSTSHRSMDLLVHLSFSLFGCNMVRYRRARFLHKFVLPAAYLLLPRLLQIKAFLPVNREIRR